MSFQVEITGIEDLNQALGVVDRALVDLSPVFEPVSRIFYDFEAKLFDSEGASGADGRWAPLTRAYAQWKAIEAPGKPILDLTGDLRDTLTTPTAPGSYHVLNESELSIGTTDPKAKYHLTGTRKMVARPPFALTDAQKQTLIDTLRIGLIFELKGSKFIVTEA